METLKVRITAKENIMRKFAVIFMQKKVAVAFSRDSGAKVGYDVHAMLEGDIDSGGSAKNWHCYVGAGSVFELEVCKVFFDTNKNRVKKWDIEVIEEFTENASAISNAVSTQGDEIE